MRFQEEKLKDCLEEAKPLLYAHWKEIAHYQDIEFAPDYEQYFRMEEAGVIKVFTAREQSVLVGYAVYFIRHHIHYKSCLCAYQDILFLDPNYRRTGGIFIKWCDERLKELGVQLIIQHIKAAHNFGKMLERFGYELMDLIFVKKNF